MCEHIVGMLHYADYSDVVTLEELIEIRAAETPKFIYGEEPPSLLPFC